MCIMMHFECNFLALCLCAGASWSFAAQPSREPNTAIAADRDCPAGALQCIMEAVSLPEDLRYRPNAYA